MLYKLPTLNFILFMAACANEPSLGTPVPCTGDSECGGAFACRSLALNGGNTNRICVALTRCSTLACDSGECATVPDESSEETACTVVQDSPPSCGKDCEQWATDASYAEGWCAEEANHCRALVNSDERLSCDAVCANAGLSCSTDAPYYWIAGYPRYRESCDLMVSDNLFTCDAVPSASMPCATGGIGEFDHVECYCNDL